MAVHLVAATFVLLVILLAQTWAFYPASLWLYSTLSHADDGKSNPAPWGVTNLPAVSVILPVHNAEATVVAKIHNLLNLDYPRTKLEIIVISDGSTDATLERVRTTFGSQIRLRALSGRVGKSAAQNCGFTIATHPVLLLTDVDALMEPDSLTKMVAWFTDPSVGCVGANVRFHADGWEVSGSHNTYWSLEQKIRMAESRLGVLTSISGAALAIRGGVVQSLDEDTGDDFILPLEFTLHGFRTIFAADALVYDHWSSSSFLGELRARRRITLRNCLGLLRRRRLLNPLRYPLLSVSLASHKLLRWLTPALLIGLMIVTGLMSLRSQPFRLLLTCELAGCGLACAGLLAAAHRVRIPVLSQLGSFAWTSLGMLWGLTALLSGTRIRDYKNTSPGVAPSRR